MRHSAYGLPPPWGRLAAQQLPLARAGTRQGAWASATRSAGRWGACGKSECATRNNEGALTTSSGFVIQPEIVIPEDAQEINVSSDGVVSVQLPGAVEQEEVGQVELAEFQNRNGLQPIGESFFVETPHNPSS